MKKILCSFAALALLASGARADEGMWLLPLLKQMNAKPMAELGLKLSPEEIYSINHSSLKDAIVHFGGGCTGEIISDQGLLVTNHHCGYGSIQGLSTPEHNYLENGFWAMNRGEEIPAPGLSVTFLVSMTDVTDIVTKADDTQAAIRDLQQKAVADNPNCTARVSSFYNENVYYLIVSKTYTDVRFVGAPPASVGKFGGEADNWEWPRHTGDFSMFRVYAGADNEPAAYSENNVPYRPKQSLKISLAGVKPGDFTFIMGYPGSTQRFQTADQLQNMIDGFAIRVAARTARQDVMVAGMEADPVVRLKYANKYAGSANGWKKWQGEALAFEKLNIIGREKEKEAEFMKWVAADPARVAKYGTALQDISEVVNGSKAAREESTLLNETVYTIGPLSLVSRLASALQNRGQNRGEVSEAPVVTDQAIARVAAAFRDYDEPLEKRMAVRMLEFYRENAKPEDYLNEIGDFADMDFQAYVDDLFANTAFSSEEKLQTLKGKSLQTVLAEDPAGKLYTAVVEKISSKYPAMYAGQEKSAAGAKAFAAGLLEWRKGEPSYPDANSTMRLTYGTIGGYSPRDGVIYNYFTTLDGVMEKENPEDYEFIVPAGLKALWQAKDFGQYAENGKLPVCFLSNNDITGGNSGSPIMNARGELIGLAFDGNWESMSSDVMFEPDLQRCINVDIRYVLFLMDKLGGAGYLLDEMQIVR